MEYTKVDQKGKKENRYTVSLTDVADSFAKEEAKELGCTVPVYLSRLLDERIEKKYYEEIQKSIEKIKNYLFYIRNNTQSVEYEYSEDTLFEASLLIKETSFSINQYLEVILIHSDRVLDNGKILSKEKIRKLKKYKERSERRYEEYEESLILTRPCYFNKQTNEYSFEKKEGYILAYFEMSLACVKTDISNTKPVLKIWKDDYMDEEFYSEDLEEFQFFLIVEKIIEEEIRE